MMEVVRLSSRGFVGLLLLVCSTLAELECVGDCGPWFDLGPNESCDEAHQNWRMCDDGCDEFKCCEGTCAEDEVPENIIFPEPTPIAEEDAPTIAAEEDAPTIAADDNSTDEDEGDDEDEASESACVGNCSPWFDLGPSSECDESQHRNWRMCDEGCDEFKCCEGTCAEDEGPDNIEATTSPEPAVGGPEGVEPTDVFDFTFPPLATDSPPAAPGTKTCVSDCSLASDFVKTYNWLTETNELCDNEITRAVTGRGGEGCTSDPWFTIEACDPATCMKFVWRASYPLQCDVEDRYLWCCGPRVTTPAVTTGANCDSVMECHVTVDEEDVDNITWFDAAGTDLSFISTYSQSLARVDADKVVSVLRADPGSLSAGQHVMTCQVSDGTTVTSSEGVLSIFSVTAEGTVEYIDSAPADLVCTVLGAQWDNTDYEVFWYTQVGGEEVLVTDGGGYTTSISEIEGGMEAKLTVAAEYQNIGDTVYTCKVQHTSADACSSDVCTEEAEATLSIVDVSVSPQNYCAKVGEEATVSFVVVGSDESWPRDSVVFTGGNMEVFPSDPSDVHRITWAPNADGDMVATLILAPILQDTVETRVYAGTAVYNEFRVDVPIFLHVMDVRPADEGVAPLQIGTDQGTLLTVVVLGGTMKQPVWSDEQGNTFRADSSEEGYDVTVSPDGSETSLQISSQQLTKIGTKVYTVTVDLYSPAAVPGDAPCMTGTAQITLETFQCHMVYEERSCDPERQTCTSTQIVRPGTCVCDGDNEGTCGDEITAIPVSCPPTLSFEVSEWDEETCNEERCYSYPLSKSRTCTCGLQIDKTKCGGELLDTFYICPGTKPWTLTPWSDLLCPADPCYPALSQITRECVCDGFSDRGKCEEETEAFVDCPVEPFGWSEWEVKDCSNTGCHPVDKLRARSCTCNSNVDVHQCEGDSVEEYHCAADEAWLREPVGPSVCRAVDLCHHVTLPQLMQCSCGGEVDATQCEGDEDQDIFCPATKRFSLSEWEAVNECTPCFPEIPQTKTRSCSCGDEVDETGEQCQGALIVTESCPATGDWAFTEWSSEPCQESCDQVVQTSRSRQCECDGNLDNTRCTGALNDVVDCELTPYEWSEWTERKCPNVCYSATTKRYRVCSCLGRIDFSECPGLSLEFRPCELPASCLPPA